MPRAHRANLPSYIPAANFSAALIDLVATGKFPQKANAPAGAAAGLPTNLDDWRKAAALIDNQKIQDAVRSAFELGGGDLDAARANLEIWYNGTMDRVSGWYKRRSQRTLFLVGLFIAVGLNIDAITVVRELSESSALRAAALAAAEKVIAAPPAGTVSDAAPPAPTLDEFTASAEGTTPLQTQPPAGDAVGAAPEAAGGTTPDATDLATESDERNSEAAAPAVLSKDYEMARDAIKAIGYPVGWSPPPQIRACRGSGDKPDLWGDCSASELTVAIASALAGWVATALAVMLGAPFWFDILNKFMVIRSTVKPYEKSPPKGSEDRPPAKPAVAAPKARGMP
jgi:hypothetical protein